jgi:hypothetical protein
MEADLVGLIEELERSVLILQNQNWVEAPSVPVQTKLLPTR